MESCCLNFGLGPNPLLMFQFHLFLEKEALLLVTHALATFQLDYCSGLYMGLPLKNT